MKNIITTAVLMSCLTDSNITIQNHVIVGNVPMAPRDLVRTFYLEICLIYTEFEIHIELLVLGVSKQNMRFQKLSMHGEEKKNTVAT